MSKNNEKDSVDFLDLVGERISQGMNIILALFWRKVKLVNRLLYSLLVATYKLVIAFLVPILLMSFGVEIIFFTDLSLIWKLLGLLMFIAGLSVFCLVFLSLFFGSKQDHNKTLTEASDISASLCYFTGFFLVSLYIISGLKQSNPFSELGEKYNFKFPLLKLLQENVGSVIAIFLFVVVIVIFLRLFSLATDKNFKIEI